MSARYMWACSGVGPRLWRETEHLCCCGQNKTSVLFSFQWREDYLNLPRSSSRPLSFLLEQELPLLLSEEQTQTFTLNISLFSAGVSKERKAAQSFLSLNVLQATSNRWWQPQWHTPLVKRCQQPRVQDVLLRLPAVVPENIRNCLSRLTEDFQRPQHRSFISA